jgi:serine/threonine protein phosphatase PrpC
VLILASDGLWDVIKPKGACEIAIRAKNEGRCASDDLVMAAIEDMPLCGVRDNVTAIVIFLNEEPARS